MGKHISFQVPSTYVKEAIAIISDIDEYVIGDTITTTECEEYIPTRFELDQLEKIKSGENDVSDFVSAHSLKYPLNLFAFLIPKENKILLPSHFRFSATDYNKIKNILKKELGKYVKNLFVFNESGIDVYNRVLAGNLPTKTKYQFFETPEELADEMIKLANIKPDDKILEPSAGKGAIIKSISKHTLNPYVDVFELLPSNIEELKKMKDIEINVVGYDFINEDTDKKYNKIIANPPFSNNQDILHIRKMYDCLEDNGLLISICSLHWEFSNNKKEKEFREWLKIKKAIIKRNNPNSFKISGTNIDTGLLIIKKSDEIK